jgi:hypothetical protein
MATREPRVDAYIAKAPAFAKPILTRFRKAVHAGCPDVVETIKWSVPFFEYKGTLASMAFFKAHTRFGFWKGSLLASAPQGKSVAGMNQFGSVSSIDDMPSEASLVRMVKEAAALNGSGVKVARERKPKAPLKAPAALLAALKKNKKAGAAFAAFSPSARRDYIEWVIQAKSEATRKSRLDTAIAWIAEGKKRHWKYER